MTVEELRREARGLGYNIIPIAHVEKMLPCVCGCNRREHWTTYVKGRKYSVLKCKKCGSTASGRTEREARRNWNAMVRGGQNAQTD